ncbi:MAG TPA: tetratricopeptide repeat protein, partial [Vicinamibacterales bacterium]
LNPQADDEYLGEGISEELINALARSENLRVIARASTLSFKEGDRNLADIAAKLRVDSLLTGRVRRVGDRIRISVELVRASDGTQLWSQSYENDPKDVFAAQQQISNAVADVLKVKLAGAAPSVVNSDAYESFLQGNFFVNKGNPVNTTKAIDYFNAALQHDPNYARAYAGLARAYVNIAVQNVPSPEIISKAREAANRALQLDPALSEAHASLAYLKQTYDWDWQGAEAEFRLAVEANPKNVDARFLYAGLLMNLERTGESSAQLKLAEELDPLSPTLPWFRAILLFVERRYAEGEREILKTLASSPENPNAHTSYGIIAFALGKNDEAVAAFRRAFGVANTPIVKARLGWALGHAGKVDEARQLLGELEQEASRDQAAPAQVAMVAGGLGELDTAFRWLDEAVRLHDPALVQARIAPFFAELRADPRFDRVLERVGLKATR